MLLAQICCEVRSHMRYLLTPARSHHLLWSQIHLSHLLTPARSHHLLWSQIHLSHLLTPARSLHMLWNQIHLHICPAPTSTVESEPSLDTQLPGPYICCVVRSI